MQGLRRGPDLPPPWQIVTGLSGQIEGSQRQVDDPIDAIDSSPPVPPPGTPPSGASETLASATAALGATDAAGAALADIGVGVSAGAASDPAISAAQPEPASALRSEPSPARGRFRRTQKRPQHRRTHPRRRMVLAVIVVVVALLGASGAVVAVRLHVRSPVATIRATVAPPRVVPGTAPAIPWPAGVQSAIAIPALGISAQSAPQIEAPIASVTKLMTAHVVLSDHPLAPGEDGPSITITGNDVELYEDDVASDQANIQVAVGEVLTEHQMLEGMLVHSANNFADLLAIWDAGSIAAFVTKMNADAASLGMTQTQYADASGFSTQSVSTPADQLKVASQDVANPVFDQIVDMPTVTLPVGGTVGSYTPLLGVDGVVGVKSGFTSAAGGCDILALLQNVNGIPVEVLAAVVAGSPPP